MLENSVINEDKGLENDFFVRSFLVQSKPKVVVDFLTASHWRYEHEIIPKIEQNFIRLIKTLPNEPTLPVIFNLFLKFQLSLKLHIRMEEEIVFPKYLCILKREGEISMTGSHEAQEPYVNEIIKLLNRTSYSKNPFCQLLIQRLDKFEIELNEHAWIEENIIRKNLQ